MRVQIAESTYEFEISYPVVVIGAGACGLSAALAVRDQNIDVLVLERDDTPMGTTAMSTGLIPAAGTPEQKAQDITDSPKIFAADIQRKSGGKANPEVVDRLAKESAETVLWLRETHQIPLTLVDGFTYPGHSARRMYGTPNRHGSELMGALQAQADKTGVDILTDSLVEDLIVDDQKRLLGVRFIRPDGEAEEVGCDALILACCGFAGNEQMVAEHIPEMEKAVFHGHPGNRGHAVFWGSELGAQLSDMDAYQGHGGLAYGYGVPILWPMIMEGGFQINNLGERFSDETKGYSEQAVNVLRQPDSIAWSILDERLYELMIEFDDFKEAISAGAVVQASSIEELAEKTGAPLQSLNKTFETIDANANANEPDEFGRKFRLDQLLSAPYYCVRVTGALFHTQGGLEVDADARVISEGIPLPNLFAGGGAARGISGAGGAGYIAGNGLLTATSLGKIAGRTAAEQVSS